MIASCWSASAEERPNFATLVKTLTELLDCDPTYIKLSSRVFVTFLVVAGGDGELGCLCGKAGTSHLCDGSAHLSGCVVNGSNAMAAV